MMTGKLKYDLSYEVVYLRLYSVNGADSNNNEAGMPRKGMTWI